MNYWSLFVLCSALPACSSAATARGGQTGEENFGCVVVDEQPLGADEVSPIGVAPGDVLGIVASPFAARLFWADGAAPASEPSTGVQLTFANRESSSARYVREEARTDREIALDCSAYVAVTGTLSLRTDDGAFDESWTTALRARVPSRAEAYVTLEWAALNGTFDFDRLLPEGHTALDGHASLAFEGTGAARKATGTVSGVAQRQQGDAVGAQFLQIGMIGDGVAGR